MKSTRRRGYLLIETAIAGGVLLAAVGVAFALVAQGRTRISAGAKRVTAAALLSSKVDELASQTSCSGSSDLVDVGGDFPGMKWSWNVGNAGAMNTSSPLLTMADAPLCEAKVVVEFPVAVKSADDASDGVPDNGRARLELGRMWRP
jgi:hypothetical protein